MKFPKTENLTLHQVNDVPFYTFPSLDRLDCVAHGVSTRLGGVSQGCFESMNLSFGRGDDDDCVKENFNRFCNAIGVPMERTVFSHQTHSINVRCVDEKDAGSGVVREREYDDVDALVTNIPNIPLCTLYADCVPLFFADPVKRVVATAHSGWRGTVHKIGAETVKVMQTKYGCNIRDVHAGIGPSIGFCCFEIDEPVFKEFSSLSFFDEKCGISNGNGKYHVNLWEVNKRILLEVGILEENISVTDVCTKCNPDVLWSHRITGPERGSLAGMIMLKEK